jgi:hypothetical protein
VRPRVVGIDLQSFAVAGNRFVDLPYILEKIAQVCLASGVVWVNLERAAIVIGRFVKPLLNPE